MRPIPKKLRHEMSSDPYYERCCLRYESPCKGYTEWHHHLLYEGRQVNEKFCILPLCQKHHQQVTDGHQKLTKVCDAIMKERATQEEINKYDL